MGDETATVNASWFIYDLADYVEETMRSVTIEEPEAHYERNDVLRYFVLWLLNEYCFDKKVRSDIKAKARIARKLAKAKAARKAAALAAKIAKAPVRRKAAKLKTEKEEAPQNSAANSTGRKRAVKPKTS